MFVQQTDSVNVDNSSRTFTKLLVRWCHEDHDAFQALAPIVEHELLMDGKRVL
jgi:hypothetical protein